VVTQEQLAHRKAVIAASPELAALLARLTERAQPVIARMPPVPQLKALLSREGGLCPRDGSPLVFDPWSTGEHRCGVCKAIAQGERQDRHWAKLQHLWLAERAAHLATVAALGEDGTAAERSAEILQAYQKLYFELPNRDNVLGPTHLFFSTYLESIWILNYLAAATLLRESRMLPEDVSSTVDAIADEAANVIGDFNEGFSNRQTWHAAALTAIATWFGDEDLARSSIEGRTGLVGHLADGFGEDGTWYEGENYHLFALRGLLTGLGWAAAAGAELLEDTAVADHLRQALMAPALTALPDLTFPARKDSRFGVSLAQPMYLEIWEVGRGMLGPADDDLAAWLSALYRSPAQPAISFESYLHEAGEPSAPARTRTDLSWWSLLGMAPELSSSTTWEPGSKHFPAQGLAILRHRDRYASLECGNPGGGHGHPDRLHLTLHAGGVHWLPDFGTGSYVSRDLFWYRSTLAHNAPLVDGVSQPFAEAACEMFDVQGEWAWVRGRFHSCERILVAGPEYLVDVTTYADDTPGRLDLPWHLSGETAVESGGRWEAVELTGLQSEFIHQGERFVPDQPGVVVLRGTSNGSSCRILLDFEGELCRGRAPGPPGAGEQQFFIVRGNGSLVRTVAVIDSAGRVTSLERDGDVITVVHASTDRHTPLLEGWQIESGSEVVRLDGVVRTAAPPEPILTRERADRPEATAPFLDERPALDGSEAGFDLSHPLTMDTELQYRRSEEPWTDPEYFSATAWVNWSEEEIYLLLEVTKADPWFRPGSAEPLELDNEVDDIHSDGIQLYLKQGDQCLEFLIVPDADSDRLRVSAAEMGEANPDAVSGAWSMTPEGYRITLAVRSGWILDDREPLEFDLLVNEMRPGRQRRAGQLVWSGGNGWVYLRGDRQDPSRFGLLHLAI
jgi:hypothetical protein